MHILKYQRFPNNEVRATHYYRARPKEQQECPDSASNVTGNSSCGSAPDDESPSDSSVILDISGDLAKRHATLPFKKTVFGSNAKNTLLRIGGAYDTLSDEPSDFVFLTGTLPGNTPAAFRVIAEYSAHIARTLADWLRQTVKSEHWFYVWELQKRGALHFHYCVHVPDRAQREKILSTFKAKWTAMLDDISARSGTCLWETDSRTCWTDRYNVLQAYAQPVHTSVAAYMAGYLAGNKDKHQLDRDSPYYPSRWWGCSRKSTNLLKSLTETVVTEHTNYRDARYKMQVHYEQVLHDSPKAYHYQHKVGIGSTCVSYHPEDKGLEIWQGLQKMTLQHKHHPNICSMIHVVQKLFTYLQPYVAASKNSPTGVQKRVLQDLQDLTLRGSLRRHTLRDSHLSILRTARSISDLKSDANLHQSECARLMSWLDAFLEVNQGHLQWNRYGWLSNPEDLPHTVDMCRTFWQSSTTDSDGADPQGGAAHGSISPQNSPSPQSLLQLCLLDSLEPPQD